MGLFNSRHGYGALAKLLHWAIVVIFAFQYVGAAIMLRTGDAGTTLGLSQATYYNWHKSVGLIALAFAVMRLLNRRVGELPPWATTLSPLEQQLIHRMEQLLYVVMFLMPVSGLVFVMAGGYGVRLFGLVDLPNPIGEWALLAGMARFVHVATGIALLLPLGLHLGIVLGHHCLAKDGLLKRMLFAKQTS
ncbi:MAG: cytochrome b [Hyphomicrobiaceae bacterium]